jgi:hypothetical protein
MLRNSYAPGAFSRRLRWFGAFLALSLVMSALAPVPAAGVVSAFANPTLDATTVNPQTGLGHVTVSVTCLIPLASIVIHLSTTQIEGQVRFASSGDRGGLLTGCQAGQRVSMVLTFGRPNDLWKFAPGPATMLVLVGPFQPCCVVDAVGLNIGPMTVLLHPER